MAPFNDHQQYRTHHWCVNKHGERKVLVLVGRDLPDLEADNVADADIIVNHRLVLALFNSLS
jgi:hypothetical protein